MLNWTTQIVFTLVFAATIATGCGSGDKDKGAGGSTGGETDSGTGTDDAGGGGTDSGGGIDDAGTGDDAGTSDDAGTDAGTTPDTGTEDSGEGDSGPGDAGEPKVINVAGEIAADATWAGTVRLTANVTIAPGVVVTVEPGTEVRGTADVLLDVKGTLNVAGTAESGVKFLADVVAKPWIGIAVSAGGTLAMTFADVTGMTIAVHCNTGSTSCDLSDVRLHDVSRALELRSKVTAARIEVENTDDGGVTIAAGADVTITDSRIWGNTGDLVKSSGGTFAIDHSEIGSTATYEHCLIHIGKAAKATITNNVLVSGVYAFMIGGTSATVVNYNNITKNTNAVMHLGGASNVDMRYNYWDPAAPAPDAIFDTSAPAAAPYPDAGPR